MFVVSHDIPLSRQTVDAWKSQGGVVLKRHRDRNFIDAYLGRHLDTEFVLNLGSAVQEDTVSGVPVINPNHTVEALWYPGTTRRSFDEVLPPMPIPGDYNYWIKAVGRGGRGKIHYTDTPYQAPYPAFRPSEDAQRHIEGDEYRVITVGGRIVQQARRLGPNGDRTYRWLPREELPNTVTDVVARAVRNMGTYTLVAWDTIAAEEGGYVFEGNCCPGVKEPTVVRIVNAVRRLINA